MAGKLVEPVTGVVNDSFFRNFDEGVLRTMIEFGFDGTQQGSGPGQIPATPDARQVIDEIDRADPLRLVVKVEGLQFYQPDLSADKLVSVVFASPEQHFTGYNIPSVVLRREEATPDLARWHSEGAIQYRIPSQQSHDVTVTVGGQTITGPSQVEELRQAWPYDLIYSILAIARSRHDAGILLRRVLRAWQPYGRVLLRDSRGEVRSYEAFMEGVSPLDEVVDVTGRTVAHSVSLRIAGEIDQREPEIYPTVTETKVTLVPKSTNP